MRLLWNAENWDRKRPNTIKGVSYLPASDLFERFRSAYIAEANRHLAILRSRERCWLGEKVDGLDVEYRLRHIAGLIRPRKKLAFYGRASSLKYRFGAQGLVDLAQLLDELESLFPRKLSWGNIYEETYAVDTDSTGKKAK
jgi:hypothetical protein